MQYNINGKVINSHNAAKPHSQSAKGVVECLNDVGPVKSILDFGCGKLRYSSYLSEISRDLCFVDSKVQLERVQTIKGERSSVIDYVDNHYPKSRCVALENIEKLHETFDLIFCSNVLSAIPCKNTLNETMASIFKLLSSSGTALIVNQHRSSYFKKFEEGDPHLYGYLHQGRRGTSYYGIINKDAILELATTHNLNAEIWVKGDRTFAYLSKYANNKINKDAV
jgi:2-polyprenyl-3-methyl-5-hydroxy-6-metoxy-1,4-benzoquinol methylase